jgi:poly-gamma-glutamate synthesis protein (capsule biosynthesis protein)
VRITVAVSGDFLIHAPVWQRAAANAGGRGYDFRPMLASIRPYIRGADLALCHVETPLTRAPPRGYPVFNTPPALARAIAWAGHDACDTASNHTLDRGQPGIDETISVLRRAGLGQTGSARSAAGARRIVMLRAKGVRVAYLAYTAVSNGQVQPHPWSVNRASAGRILRDARRARRAGADAVIVNVHWGEEYRSRPSASQVALARRLVRSPAITAIAGQHVHVVQPVRRVRGRLVVFGEGNLLSNQTPACCAPGAQDGLIALLRLEVRPRGGGRAARARLARVDYVPTWVRRPDFRVLPVWRARVAGSAPRADLVASWRRTTSVAGRGRGWGPWREPRP